MEVKNERSSNIELLRIILIIMIIVLHYFNASMGGLLGAVEENSVNYYLSHFLESLCIIAVNVFIIITGYFSYKKTSIKISKPINLFVMSIFYGIIISCTIIFMDNSGINKLHIYEIVKVSLTRWFVVIYCILYLLIPYINKLINSLTKKQFKTLLLINIIFFYVWPIFSGITIQDGGYGIVNFVNLYMIGAYIKMYKDENVPKTLSIIVYLECTLITTICSFYITRCWLYSNIINLISSIALFELFKSIKMKNSKLINKLATYTFSTYIIHENSFLVTVLYRKVFSSDQYWNSNYMILNLIICTFGIYAICILVEFIRRLLFKKIIDDKINNIKYEISCE